jgi:hypothetical protein
MKRHRVSRRKKRPARRTKRNGGGWSDLGKGLFGQAAVISPGNPVHIPYTGAGKDCPGVPIRPGTLTNYSATGLPGFSGGKRKRSSKRSGKRSSHKRRHTRGGRYGISIGSGPLNLVNGVGTTPGQIQHIPCESARANPMNPTQRGGGPFPAVNVGAFDAMRYNAPTAGYKNDFSGGLMVQTPYDARAFNSACMKTGGSRRKSRK